MKSTLVVHHLLYVFDCTFIASDISMLQCKYLYCLLYSYVPYCMFCSMRIAPVMGPASRLDLSTVSVNVTSALRLPWEQYLYQYKAHTARYKLSRLEFSFSSKVSNSFCL